MSIFFKKKSLGEHTWLTTLVDGVSEKQKYKGNFSVYNLFILLFVFYCLLNSKFYYASQVALVEKDPPANAGDAKVVGSIPGWGRSPGEGNGNLLQYSCLENSMNRGAWWTTIHGVAKSQAQLSNWTHAHRFYSDFINFSTSVFFCISGPNPE